MNLAVSPKRRTDRAIRGIDMKLWVCCGRVTDVVSESDTEKDPVVMTHKIKKL